MDSELLALQWMEHSRIFSQAIGSLRGKAAYTDATLACEGRFFPVHKFVLSTCSEYFSAIFEWTPCVNPVVVLNNVACKELEALLDFMYIGEVNVREAQIPDVMHAAECLRIRGLAMIDEDGVKTQLSARNATDLDGPVKKKRRPDVHRSVATTSQIQLPPPTHPAPHLSSHTPRLPPPTVVATTSTHQSSSESKIPPAVDHHDNANLSHHSQLLKPLSHQIQQPQTSPIQNGAAVNLPPQQSPQTPQPSHTSLRPQLVVNQNPPNQTSPSHLPAPQHVGPTDLSIHGQSQEINISSALPPIDKVIEEVKMKLEETKEEVLEPLPEDGTVGIPELLDSLVDMRPLYDAKGTQGEEIATFHSAEANENLYDFTEEFPETSSSQSDAHYQRNHTTPSSLIKVEQDSSEEAPRYKCQCCNRAYQKKESLTRHMRVHSKEPYTCSICGQINKTYKCHLEHRKEHHTRQPQQKKESSIHTCTLCSFTSNRQDNVKRHMLSHTGEKPHKCPHCTFRAKRSQYLHRHIKNIHKK